MPEFRHAQSGRRLRVDSWSALARTLTRDGEWSEAPEAADPPVPPARNLKRADLNALAASLGIESPEDLPNAEAVREAIASVNNGG